MDQYPETFGTELGANQDLENVCPFLLEAGLPEPHLEPLENSGVEIKERIRLIMFSANLALLLGLFFTSQHLSLFISH